MNIIYICIPICTNITYISFQWQLLGPCARTGDVAGRQLRRLGAVGRGWPQQCIREEEATGRPLHGHLAGAVATQTRLPHLWQTNI